MRSRLLIVALLGLLACGGAAAAVVMLLATSEEARVLLARDEATAEVERLVRIARELPRRKAARAGKTALARKSGLMDDALRDEDPDLRLTPSVEAQRADAAREAQTTGAMAVRERHSDAAVGAVAVAPAPGGGFAFAVVFVMHPPGMPGLRVVVGVLIAASVLLLAGSLHTLFAFNSDVRVLRGSLRELQRDRSARVARPRLDELRDVADGVAELATSLGAAHDEREALQADLAARERLAMLGRVVSGVAHEVRNPLAAIKLRVDLALEDPALEERLRDDLGVVLEEVRRLDRLVSDLLLVGARRKAARSACQLGELARERAERITPWAAEREVAVEASGDVLARVDRDAIARVIDNLLRNAVEAAPPRSTVEIDCADGKRAARITVRDRGPGVSPADESQLFEPFFTTRQEGTGLGLALSRAIVEAHGGSIAYRREDGLSCFTLTIPTDTLAPDREAEDGEGTDRRGRASRS
jgi:signal transduction histidine kinase